MISQNRGDGASAEVVAKRLGERLRMGNEDRRARRDAEQRVKDAAREVQKELMKLNASPRRPGGKRARLDGKRRTVHDRRAGEDDWSRWRGLNTFLRNNAEESSKRARAAAANASRGCPTEEVAAQGVGRTCFGRTRGWTGRRHEGDSPRTVSRQETRGGRAPCQSQPCVALTAAAAATAFSQRKQRREPRAVGVGGVRIERLSDGDGDGRIRTWDPVYPHA